MKDLTLCCGGEITGEFNRDNTVNCKDRKSRVKLV